ncbi:MAG: tRNA pseudouridine(38-40) synthase TruA [Bacteroidaceae bacterium]|nr:tRNA pseudouridine(38-40) synthase TruA [Bacteroidaceae bacterium]
MMRYFADIEFDGTAYSGWQIQPHSPSVQQTMEEALALFLRQDVSVTGAGRTDAGVHAAQMIAHFDLETPQDCEWMTHKLNGILPPDIAVHRIFPVKPEAHARFDALSRTYKYYVTLNKSAFDRDYSWYLLNEPDFELMNSAAEILLSTVDFTSFSKLHTDTKTNDCHVTKAVWENLPDGRWVFTITADRFLRNMVRAIVGTLMEVGRNRMTVDEFRAVIQKKDRCQAGDSAPAQGLFLYRIEYPEDIFIKD